MDIKIPKRKLGKGRRSAFKKGVLLELVDGNEALAAKVENTLGEFSMTKNRRVLTDADVLKAYHDLRTNPFIREELEKIFGEIDASSLEAMNTYLQKRDLVSTPNSMYHLPRLTESNIEHAKRGGLEPVEQAQITRRDIGPRIESSILTEVVFSLGIGPVRDNRSGVRYHSLVYGRALGEDGEAKKVDHTSLVAIESYAPGEFVPSRRLR